MISIYDINFGLTIKNTENGFTIENKFVWQDSDSTTKTAYAVATVIEKENKLTVERSLEFNNQIFFAYPIHADNYMELYTIVYGGFDFQIDAVINSTQRWKKIIYLIIDHTLALWLMFY